ILSGVMVPLILIAATCALLSPLNTGAAELQRLSGKVFEWQWVRAFSPFINLYAFFFLAGGAVYSAWHYRQAPALQHRYTGNIFIAIGAILPGIGGTFTRMGYMEVLYVTELMGLLLIYIGYRYNVANPLREPHSSINTSAA
nr:hypothetical protein [Calditrichia bacterium]